MILKRDKGLEVAIFFLSCNREVDQRIELCEHLLLRSKHGFIPVRIDLLHEAHTLHGIPDEGIRKDRTWRHSEFLAGQLLGALLDAGDIAFRQIWRGQFVINKGNPVRDEHTKPVLPKLPSHRIRSCIDFRKCRPNRRPLHNLDVQRALASQL